VLNLRATKSASAAVVFRFSDQWQLKKKVDQEAVFATQVGTFTRIATEPSDILKQWPNQKDGKVEIERGKMESLLHKMVVMTVIAAGNYVEL
jgi:hypothetical protein